jgi:SAM-dependent methyltransferase
MTIKEKVIKTKLNLGCGTKYKEGFENVDINTSVKAEKHCNLDNGIPYPDNTFDYILAVHILEHLFDKEKILKEIARVAKNGCVVKIFIPNYASRNAWDDSQHKSYWTRNTVGTIPELKNNTVISSGFFLSRIVDFMPNCIQRFIEPLAFSLDITVNVKK